MFGQIQSHWMCTYAALSKVRGYSLPENTHLFVLRDGAGATIPTVDLPCDWFEIINRHTCLVKSKPVKHCNYSSGNC